MISGAAAVLIGIVYLYLAWQLNPSALSDAVGPAGLPKAVGVVTVVLGLILLAQDIIRRAPSDLTGDEAVVFRRHLLRASGLLAIGTGFILIVSYVGYLVAIALLIGAVASY